ncbi:wax ester/triacylglycerol synthase domain-containing protein [Nocardia sp. NPDC048505]|uniref:wax ester/triacylglycerol synthase domain-containing protein n=1 Tax=unclassified Nocardia TaxID=2637762 RepID=UPI0033FD334E
MADTQLAANDASYYYLARSGRNTDWPMWWVFDAADGAAPTAAEITRHFTERAELLAPLRRRIHEVPAGLGHPYWAVDDSPIESHLSIETEPLEWARCLERIGAILSEPLDARVRAWQAHVFTAVSGIESLPGTGVLVLVQVSHALLAGPAMTALADTLFAADPVALMIQGQGPAADRPRTGVPAVAGALSWPARMLRFTQGVRAENRRLARDGDADDANITPRTKTVLNARIGAGRAVRTIPLPLAAVRRPGSTVTAVGLTAISRALERYLDKRSGECPADLTALVTVALPPSPVLGVNHIGAAGVDLFPAEPDLAARARAVEDSLRAHRDAPSSRRELNRLGLIELLPSRVFRARFGTLPPADPAAPAFGHTILTSIRCEPAGAWSLLGGAFRFAGMLPPVFPEIGLAHSFVGAGDSFTLSVVADPALVAEVDEYADLLRAAVHEVADALTAS